MSAHPARVTPRPCGRDNGITGEARETLRRDLSFIQNLDLEDDEDD